MEDKFVEVTTRTHNVRSDKMDGSYNCSVCRCMECNEITFVFFVSFNYKGDNMGVGVCMDCMIPYHNKMKNIKIVQDQIKSLTTQQKRGITIIESRD